MTIDSTESSSLHKHLAFPLNVYAHAQMLQEGTAATHLHYGLFRHKDDNFQTAQQHLIDLLIQKLPPAPCRILEINTGLGTTFSALNQQGYHVHSLTFDTQETPIISQQLEDFDGKEKDFDVIILQESAQHIEPLTIFNKALDVLGASGQLLIIDEFALIRPETEAKVDTMQLITEMISLAKQFNFELVEQLDLSIMAAPTIAYRLQITNNHQQRLIEDLGLNAHELAQLNTSNQTCQNKFSSGHYTYSLLHFKKQSLPRWRPKLLHKSQASEMLALFKETFHHSMTLSTWQWKYEAQPGREIGIWQAGHLIAHYGGINRKVLFFGQPQNTAQIVDVMVDSKIRGILTKKGPFFHMAATFLERYIGYGKPYLLGFGFPNDRHMKIAERQGLYAEVGRMTEFSWPPLPRLPRWKTRLRLIDRTENEWAAASVNACWQQMTKDFHDAIIGVRDWRYLQYRYLEHPNQAYQVILVQNRLGGRARGILVLRHDPDGCEIIDLIAALTEIPLLIIHARRLAGIGGHDRVFCRITENFAPCFKATNGNSQELDIRIPTNVWSNGPSPETLKNRWWLMSGDTDSR